MKTYEARRNGEFYNGGEFESIEHVINCAGKEFEAGRYELYEEGEHVGDFYVTVRKEK